MVSTKAQTSKNGLTCLTERLLSLEKPQRPAHCGSTVVTAATSACSTFAESASNLQFDGHIPVKKLDCDGSQSSGCPTFANEEDDTVDDLPLSSPPANHETSPRRRKKKKRIMMVRAGDIGGLSPESVPRRALSEGCGRVDSQRLKEAVMSWQAEFGEEPSSPVKIKISSSRRSQGENYRSRSINRRRRSKSREPSKASESEESPEKSSKGKTTEVPKSPRRASTSSPRASASPNSPKRLPRRHARSRSRARRSRSRGPTPLESTDVKHIENVLQKLVSEKLEETGASSAAVEHDTACRSQQRSRSRGRRHQRSRSCHRSSKDEKKKKDPDAKRSHSCRRSRSLHRQHSSKKKLSSCDDDDDDDAPKEPRRTRSLVRQEGGSAGGIRSLQGHLKLAEEEEEKSKLSNSCDATVISNDLSIENAFGLNVCAPPPPKRGILRARSLDQAILTASLTGDDTSPSSSPLPGRREVRRTRSGDDMDVANVVRDGLLTKEDFQRLSAAGYQISKDFE